MNFLVILLSLLFRTSWLPSNYQEASTTQATILLRREGPHWLDSSCMYWILWTLRPSSQTHTLNIAGYGATTNGTSTAIHVSFYVMHAHCNSLCVMFVSCVATTTTIYSLVPSFPPGHWLHTVHNTGREPGRFGSLCAWWVRNKKPGRCLRTRLATHNIRLWNNNVAIPYYQALPPHNDGKN